MEKALFFNIFVTEIFSYIIQIVIFLLGFIIIIFTCNKITLQQMYYYKYLTHLTDCKYKSLIIYLQCSLFRDNG